MGWDALAARYGDSVINATDINGNPVYDTVINPGTTIIIPMTNTDLATLQKSGNLRAGDKGIAIMGADGTLSAATAYYGTAITPDSVAANNYIPNPNNVTQGQNVVLFAVTNQGGNGIIDTNSYQLDIQLKSGDGWDALVARYGDAVINAKDSDGNPVYNTIISPGTTIIIPMTNTDLAMLQQSGNLRDGDTGEVIFGNNGTLSAATAPFGPTITPDSVAANNGIANANNVMQGQNAALFAVSTKQGVDESNASVYTPAFVSATTAKADNQGDGITAVKTNLPLAVNLDDDLENIKSQPISQGPDVTVINQGNSIQSGGDLSENANVVSGIVYQVMQDDYSQYGINTDITSQNFASVTVDFSNSSNDAIIYDTSSNGDTINYDTSGGDDSNNAGDGGDGSGNDDPNTTGDGSNGSTSGNNDDNSSDTSPTDDISASQFVGMVNQAVMQNASANVPINTQYQLVYSVDKSGDINYNANLPDGTHCSYVVDTNGYESVYFYNAKGTTYSYSSNNGSNIQEDYIYQANGTTYSYENSYGDISVGTSYSYTSADGAHYEWRKI